MKYIKILSLIGILAVVSACRKDALQPTDLAIQAMERARVFEADIYAPLEYEAAADLFYQMNEALNRDDQNLANEIAPSVVDAANNAIEVARSGKATALLAKLRQSLDTAQLIGLHTENPEVYNQATQLLIDAEDFYQRPDYEKSAIASQSGLDLLEPLIGGAESLALSNLNRARELLDRAYKTTDLFYTEDLLDEISDLIEKATAEYQDERYIDSVNSSQEAIDRLNQIIEKYPNDAAISVNVSQEENLQLQAYDLLRQLEDVLAYIKQNSGVSEVSNATVVSEAPVTHSETTLESIFFEEEEEPAEDDTFILEEVAEDDIELFIYEEQTPVSSDDITESHQSGEYGNVEILLYEEEDSNKVSYLPVTLKLQDMGELTNTTSVEDSDFVVTIEMIEDAYNDAQKYYEEANYLNSIDRSREGLRLAELYLANQTMRVHTVIRGDTLWDISKSSYDTPWLWPNIWRANKLIIKDPDLIYPKQEFRIPPAGK